MCAQQPASYEKYIYEKAKKTILKNYSSSRRVKE